MADWRSFDVDPLCARLAAMTSLEPPIIPPTIPPEVPPVADDIVLSVPMRSQHAHDDNWGKGEAFGPCRGVVLHSTGGPARTLENEYIASANWAQNPAAGVSWHRLIGGGTFSEVCTTLHDHEKAYHAREPANTNRRSIELAHPDGPEWAVVAYPTFQYEAAGELIARWKIADDARGWHWPIRMLSRTEAAADAPGIVMHKDLPGGIGDGKRDPTPPFDPGRLIATAERWHAQLTGGETPVPDTDSALLDQLYALAGQIQALEQKWAAINCPHRAAYCSNEGEAIKEFVNAAKGQR